jgi:hypothetical protein
VTQRMPRGAPSTAVRQRHGGPGVLKRRRAVRGLRDDLRLFRTTGLVRSRSLGDPGQAVSLQFSLHPSNRGPSRLSMETFLPITGARTQKKSMGTILPPLAFVDLTEKCESDEET